MKRIPLFKPGTHTDSAGRTLDFSEAALQAAVAAYNPDLHEAPLVIGHPRNNAPAFGWVGSMDYQDQVVGAIPRQVNTAFADMVKAGAFKKVSASWYMPEAPGNPAPGSWYLRHVGFLGAAPPAIKGLPPLEFAEGDEGTVSLEADFSALSGSWELNTIADVFRRLREFIVDKYSRAAADEVVPRFSIEDLEAAARRPPPEPIPDPAKVEPAFSEPTTGDTPVAEKPQVPVGANPLPDPSTATPQAPDRSVEFAEKDRLLKEREARILAKEQELARKEVTSFVDALVKEGKVLPAQRAGLVEFMTDLPPDRLVEFKEGDNTIKAPAGEWLRGFLAARPAIVEYGEKAGDDGAAGKTMSFDEATKDIASRAVDYQEEMAKKGVEISIAAAVQHVTRQGAQ